MPEELASLDGEADSDAPVGSRDDIGRELFQLVAKACAAGCDPETELRAAARRYRALVHARKRS